LLGDGGKRNNLADGITGKPVPVVILRKAARRRGRWEVYGSPGTGKPAHTFASDNDLWRWTYVLVMDNVDSA
jgi:hypothetical protein